MMIKSASRFAILLICCACGGKLSDEQRKQMHEASRQQEIKRVSEGEINDAALKRGQEILASLMQISDPASIDSVAHANGVAIRWLEPGAKNAKAIEHQLIEAYITSAVTGGIQDNIQQAGTDSLIYTKPVAEEMPDGAVHIKGMWSIWLSRKQVVLSLE